MSETLSRRTAAPSAKAGGRPPLTHVPLSATPLPPVDATTKPWPGTEERVGDLRLHVRRTPGADHARVVYVHGLGGSSTNWTDLAALLSPVAGGAALDLPGFGFSEPADGFTFSLSAHADVVARFVEQDSAEPVHLVGNSMGGAIALLVAARRPELVRTLTLVSPAMPDRRLDPRRLSDPRMALAYLPVVGKKARRELAALGPRERAEQVIRLCFAEPHAFPEHRLDELAEEHSARAAYEWVNHAMARSTMEIFRMWFTAGSRSLWSVARTVEAPSLVVWGTKDRVISVRRAKRTAQVLPRSRLLVLPRTGHVAQMERPRTVARAVLGMWESVETGEW
ncbi:alpha/beta fold hydrolase [Prauserella muralis]|uniref:Hydrolase n=1 Tax=Prauserella muralis TaxID=588067 RepID=A0A2V4BB28_9PSEU|nr:alpha/beta fold hydrolase [Prauserella muralis]PXY32460.1 hydrolase [Prauserella muralis]TWE23842.1 pimeloyl-ACP methyl ester carboxylesterase [Prauserella muralis]